MEAALQQREIRSTIWHRGWVCKEDTTHIKVAATKATVIFMMPMAWSWGRMGDSGLDGDKEDDAMCLRTGRPAVQCIGWLRPMPD